jgi:hypothetical protein
MTIEEKQAVLEAMGWTFERRWGVFSGELLWFSKSPKGQQGQREFGLRDAVKAAWIANAYGVE